MDTIDYKELSRQSEMMKHKAINMINDPKTKAEQFENIYFMLGISEKVNKIVDEYKKTGMVV